MALLEKLKQLIPVLEPGWCRPRRFRNGDFALYEDTVQRLVPATEVDGSITINNYQYPPFEYARLNLIEISGVSSFLTHGGNSGRLHIGWHYCGKLTELEGTDGNYRRTPYTTGIWNASQGKMRPLDQVIGDNAPPAPVRAPRQSGPTQYGSAKVSS
jgi:hypothetical protein